MVHAIERHELLHRLVHGIDDAIERRVDRVDEILRGERLAHEGVPLAPVRRLVRLHQHHRHDRRLARLHERQHLEGLVHRAEPARKERDPAGFLHEEQLAGEEILEGDQLGVGGDPRIRLLLERQPDVEPERPLAAGALLRGAHDACAGPGHHHPAALDHAATEHQRGHGGGLRGRRARGPEHRHLADVAIRREHLVGVAQLLERGVRHLEIACWRTVLVELEDRREHVLEVAAAVGGHAEHVEQVYDQAIGFFVL